VKFKTVVVAFFALALAGSAMADVIDFSTGSGTPSGTLSWTGGTAALIGSNIVIEHVGGSGTPSNSGVQAPIIGGILSFTTGTFNHYDSLSDTYFWNTGGSIQITGSGPGCLTLSGCGSGTPNTSSGSPLLAGNLISAELVAGQIKIVLTSGTDTKDPLLLNFYGEPSGKIWDFSGSVHTTAVGAFNPTTGFSVQSAGSTDVLNSVPDGGLTLMLLGGAMAGLEGLRRRFRV
jgi:hypothetical protein